MTSTLVMGSVPPVALGTRPTVADETPACPQRLRPLVAMAESEQWTGRALLVWQRMDADLWFDHGRVLVTGNLREASEEVAELLCWQDASIEFEHGLRRTGVWTPIAGSVLLRNAERTLRGRLPLIEGLEAHVPVSIDLETAQRAGYPVPAELAAVLDGTRTLFRAFGALAAQPEHAPHLEQIAAYVRELARAGAIRRSAPEHDEPVPDPRGGGWKKMLSWLVGDEAEPARGRTVTSEAKTIVTLRASLIEGVSAPWDSDRPAIGADPSETRAALVTALAAELDTCEHEGDRLFVAQLARSVRRGVGVPELPAALSILASPSRDPRMDDVARVVKSEPTLEREVMRRANAATFARPTADLRAAIARIGISRVSSMVAWRFLSGAAFTIPSLESDVRALRILAATTSELASELAPASLRGELRLAGLFHEVGRFVVLRASVPPPGEKRALERRIKSVSSAYDVSIAHTIVGGWGLSPIVCEAIARHPDAAVEGSGTEHARALRIARVAAWGAALGHAIDLRSYRAAMNLAGESRGDLLLKRAQEIRKDVAA